MSLFGRVADLITGNDSFGSKRDALDAQAAAFKAGTDSVNIGNITPERAYKQQAWVYAAVQQIGRTISQVPYRLKKEDVEITDSPSSVARIFRQPSPRVCKSQFWFNTVSSLELAGNSIWKLEIVRLNGKDVVAQILVLNPRLVVPRIDKANGELLGYTWTQPVSRTRQNLSLDEVIHLQYPDPFNPFWGMASLLAAMPAVRTDMKASAYNEQFFENAAVPHSILIDKNGRLSSVQRDQLKRTFNDDHAGISNAHNTMVLSGDFAFHALGIGQREMEFMGQRKFTREQIGAIFGVPGILTNDPNQRNFATAKTELRIFADHKWLPIVSQIQDTIQSQFLDRFAPGVTGWFDTSDAPGLRKDRNELVTTAKTLFDMGVSLNKVIDYTGLNIDPEPWGDTWYKPISDVDVNEVPATDPPVPADTKPKTKSGLIDDPRRVAYWRGFIKRIEPLENRFAKRWKRHIQEIRSSMLGNLMDIAETGRDIRMLSDDEFVSLIIGKMADFDDSLQVWATPLIKDGIEQGGNMIRAELGVAPGFTIESQLGLDAFKDRTNKIVGINNVVFGSVSTSLREGLKNGETINDLAGRVRDVMSAASNRSRTIARTEMGTAVSRGRQASMKEQNVSRTEWLSARDDVVRTGQPFNHRIDGEIVHIDKEFSNGLRFPLDDGASGSEPGNIISCRCVSLPRV